MKAFAIGVGVAIVLAVAVAFGLQTMDQSTAERYSTENVRL
jgi:hypothetical protein